MDITTARLEEVFKIHELIGKLEGLVQHPVHFYNIMIRYFGNTFFVAKEGDKIAGFVWGFISQSDPEVLFLWQIGVTEEYRGNQLSRKLIDSFTQAARDNGCTRIHATVEPENIPSWKMFEKMGFKSITKDGIETITQNEKEAMVDYYGSGTNQFLYEYIPGES